MLPASDLTGTVAHVSDIGPAHRELNKLRKDGLTVAGQRWLEAALDPFHDEVLECEGYPDYTSCSTLVQAVRVSTDISAPAGIAAGETWGCHIVSTPYNETLEGLTGALTNGTEYTTNLDTPVPYAGSMGMITVATVPPGSAFKNAFASERNWPVNTGPGAVYYEGLSPVELVKNGSQWLPSRPYTTGRHRIIAAGFEVINTSAPLQRSGLITCYRQPGALRRVCGAEYQTETATAPRRFTNLCVGAGPPPTQKEALNSMGGRQWAASEGAYVPLVLSGDDLPLEQAAVTEVAMVTDISPGFLGSGFERAYVRATSSGGFGTAPQVPVPKSINHFEQSGVVMTGLSPETKLTVSLRVIVERAPTASEPDLIPLARPSPAADPVAWMVYTEAIRLMPPGVILSENFLGGWFRQVVSNVHKTLAPSVSRGIKAIAPHAQREVRRLADRAVDQAVEAGIEKMSGQKRRPRKKNQTKAK
jgi:hypothetical protein